MQVNGSEIEGSRGKADEKGVESFWLKRRWNMGDQLLEGRAWANQVPHCV